MHGHRRDSMCHFYLESPDFSFFCWAGRAVSAYLDGDGPSVRGEVTKKTPQVP
jgi:hypothetical protein